MSTTIITCPVCGEDYSSDYEHKCIERTITMDKELIEKMKQNRVPNCLLTDEEWECLKSANKWQWFNDNWNKWLSTDSFSKESCLVHRIHPDWQPKPEILRVNITKDTYGNLILDESRCYYYTSAPAICIKEGYVFAGYEYAGGFVSLGPTLTIHPTPCCNKEPLDFEYPVAALYKKAGE